MTVINVVDLVVTTSYGCDFECVQLPRAEEVTVVVEVLVTVATEVDVTVVTEVDVAVATEVEVAVTHDVDVTVPTNDGGCDGGGYDGGGYDGSGYSEKVVENVEEDVEGENT